MKLNISFYGSSLVSSYWNGAATYYRGIVKALHKAGHTITFYEPDAYDRQKNKDMEEPSWCKVVVYPATAEGVNMALNDGGNADIVIKTSGVGVVDEELEAAVIQNRKSGQKVIFWDVDAPATLDRVINKKDDAFRRLIPQYDLVLTYGGGDPVVTAYKSLGAKECIPVYNGLDPDTHHPVEPAEAFQCDLAFLGNRLPDREARVEEFFLNVASKMQSRTFILGGNGWHDKPMSNNIKFIGHVSTNDHNALNSTPLAVLNISRESMARYGFSPATRVFEAAGAGACIITDHWEGIESFFTPGEEILIARTGEEVAAIMDSLTPERARRIGNAARKRVLAQHTYDQRVKLVEKAFKLSPELA